MPSLKVNNTTFGLTDNVRDVGNKRLTLEIGGKKYYARLGDTKTALVVQRISNGSKSYVQTNPIVFNTWMWSKYPNDVRGTEKMFVYLPGGRYRAIVRGSADKSNEFTVSTSTDIEVNVSVTQNTETAQKAIFNINGWRDTIHVSKRELTIEIMRIGE